MTTKKRRLNKGKIFGCLLLLASFIMVVSLVFRFVRIYERTLDLQVARTQLEQLEEQCNLIAEELELLDDENYITRYARKNWIFTKEGETVIPLPEDAIRQSSN